MTCEHTDLNFDILHQTYEGTNIRCLVLQSHCQHCAKQMRFVGIPYERPTTMDRPVISEDMFTCSISMVPEDEHPVDMRSLN